MTLKYYKEPERLTRMLHALTKRIVQLSLMCWSCFSGNTFAEPVHQDSFSKTVYAVVHPLMEKYHVPGMAVAITLNGKNYFYNYGVLSQTIPKPVTNQTLFEIGSITKTFTATLAAYAAENGHLSLNDMTSHYLPALRGTAFDNISLLNLGTHTAGTPLFLPPSIQTDRQYMDFLKQWHPAYLVGSQRAYSNIGIDLLGMSAAKSLDSDYSGLIKQVILEPLQLNHTYLTVNTNQMADYAEGYTEHNIPHRIANQIAFPEAYGIRSCSADLIRFVQANLQEIALPSELKQAILDTHTAYFKTRDQVQDLAWEQYAYPVKLEQLLAGNSPTYIFRSNPVTPILPPLKTSSQVWINKTGSTDGFSSYIAFIPAKKAGVVILANKSYPLDQRVTAGYKILAALLAIHHQN